MGNSKNRFFNLPQILKNGAKRCYYFYYLSRVVSKLLYDITRECKGDQNEQKISIIILLKNAFFFLSAVRLTVNSVNLPKLLTSKI